MDASCSLAGWTSTIDSAKAFFQTSAKESETRHETFIRNLSRQATSTSLQTQTSEGGPPRDATSWQFLSPEELREKGRELFYRHANQRQDSSPRSASNIFCSNLEQCLDVEEEDGKYSKRDLFSKRYRQKSWEPTPSREESDVSPRSLDLDRRKPLDYLHVYHPRQEMDENQHLDVLWQRECVDLDTRLVRWTGNMELGLMTAMTPPRCYSFSSSVSMPVFEEPDVGWITCYSLQRGLTDQALAEAKDPVLHHVCQRFRLMAHEIPDRDGAIPRELEQDALFAPYGIPAAQEQTTQRLKGGKPIDAVLPVSQVLQSMPIFLVSDLFVNPSHRGCGLGLVLLDRACRRIADSFCLVIVCVREHANDDRLATYLGLLGFAWLAPGFFMRRHGQGDRVPSLDEVCPFLPEAILQTSGGKL